MSQQGSKFIVQSVSYSMRHHWDDQRNPGLERGSHISKQTAWQLPTWWTVNTTGFRYSFSHNNADHHIGLQTAIKSTRVSQRVLIAIRLCYKALMCFILSTLIPCPKNIVKPWTCEARPSETAWPCCLDRFSPVTMETWLNEQRQRVC